MMAKLKSSMLVAFCYLAIVLISAFAGVGAMAACFMILNKTGINSTEVALFASYMFTSMTTLGAYELVYRWVMSVIGRKI